MMATPPTWLGPLLERSLQHEEVRTAQGCCILQVQPVAGLQVDLASHVLASAQKKGPMRRGPFAMRTIRNPGSRAASTQWKVPGGLSLILSPAKPADHEDSAARRSPARPWPS